MPERGNEETAVTVQGDSSDGSVWNAVLQNAAKGDAESVRLLMEKDRNDSIEELKYKLFGL